MKRYLTGGAAVLALAAGFGAPAFAQDAETRIAELERRIADLESRPANTPGGPNLSFGLGETQIEIYGFARFEAFYDFDFAQGDLTRPTRIGELGIDGEVAGFDTDGEFETSVRVSRLGFRSTTPTQIGEVGTQLEFDLFSGSDTTTSPQLRLRHANVTIGDQWLFGQFWTNFMPLVHYPTTADFNGPVGITFARVPQIRYTWNSGNGLVLSGSIEEAAGGSSDPVLTAAAFYGTDKWSVRAAGLVGRVDSGGEEFDTNGITLSGSISPWDGGTFSATYVTGEAIGNLLIGGGAQIVDGQTNDATGFTLEYRQALSDTLSVGIAYGREDYDLAFFPDVLPGDFTSTIDVQELETIHVNAFWNPTDRLTIAGEYIHGERTTSDGSTFDADRIGASITFSF